MYPFRRPRRRYLSMCSTIAPLCSRSSSPRKSLLEHCDCIQFVNFIFPDEGRWLPWATAPLKVAEHLASQLSHPPYSSCDHDDDCHVFKGCYSLTSVDIATSVQSIGTRAFYRCGNLTSLNLPTGLVSLAQVVAYNNFINLNEVNRFIVIPFLQDALGSNSGFQFNVALKSASLPTTLAVIPGATFYGCSALQSIIIPT